MAKTNLGMVEYARCQLGEPYWYGTYGQLGSEEVFESRKKAYPTMYPPQKWTVESFTEGYGHKVHDCSGLFKGYMGVDDDYNAPSKYVPSVDFSANMLIDACKEKGSIDTIPEIQGLVVWKDKHVGCYVGDGKVIEAKGHSYGVVMSDLRDSKGKTKWKMWGKAPFLEYITDLKPVDEFVTRLYNIVLDRAPEADGEKYWVDNLSSKKISFKDCAYAFLTCTEFMNRDLTNAQFLDVLYRTLFAREGDSEGMTYWLNYLNKHTRYDVVNAFISSPEFNNVCKKILGEV